MVRPLTFLKGPRSLCEHIFGQFSLETLFFVHLQHVIHLGGVKCRTYRGSVQKTAFWVLLQRNFFFNRNRNTRQLHRIRTLNQKKTWKMVWSLAPFWTWPGRTPGLSTIGLFRPKGRTKGSKDPKTMHRRKKPKKPKKMKNPPPTQKCTEHSPKHFCTAVWPPGPQMETRLCNRKKRSKNGRFWP